jgi:hypothetical protein
MKDLSKKIIAFLEKYAAKSPNEEDEYIGPDPYELEYVAELLSKEITPTRFPFSDWGSGCYEPYTSKEGQQEHREILDQIKKLLKR